jgi:hypothetical protein
MVRAGIARTCLRRITADFRSRSGDLSEKWDVEATILRGAPMAIFIVLHL